MLEIVVFSIVPHLFPGPLGESIFYNAMQDSRFCIKSINLRDFAKQHYNRVDDYPFGGGAGLVMKADILSAALEAEFKLQNITYNNLDGDYYDADSNKIDKYEAPLIIIPSAKGYTFNQKIAQSLTNFKKIFFICGRFEGIDQRFIDYYRAKEISIGDYVLAGGETAVFVICEAVVRLLSGVMGNKDTCSEESFSIINDDGEPLKEYCHYTRPAMWNGLGVPEVLRGGNHKEVAKWRLLEAKKNTTKAMKNPIENI